MFITSEKCSLHFVPQVGKTFSQKGPDPANNAPRKAELFSALLAQLVAQFCAQLAAEPLSLLNTQERADKDNQKMHPQLIRLCHPVPYGGTIPKKSMVRFFDYEFWIFKSITKKS